jgi:biotin transport system substrate-specific component
MRKTLDLAYIGLFAAVIAACALITVPAAVPFTLQTLGVFLSVGLLGWKRGTAAVGLYLCIGAIGVPVFSGLGGGIGVLLGPTGGFLWSFLPAALLAGLVMGKEPSLLRTAVGMVSGLLCVYAVGALWFALWHVQSGSALSAGAVFTAAILPFLLPDGVKIALAVLITRRLRRHVR